MGSGVKEHGQPPEAAKGEKTDFPLHFQNAALLTHSRMMTLQNYKMCIVLSHWICGNLLQQQQETNTHLFSHSHIQSFSISWLRMS